GAHDRSRAPLHAHLQTRRTRPRLRTDREFTGGICQSAGACMSDSRPENRSFGRKLRLGFVGLGWIGRQRMASAIATGAAEAFAVYDPAAAAAKEALNLAPGAVVFSSLADLLACDLDGVVIATPNRFHAQQSIAALERGLPVFC